MNDWEPGVTTANDGSRVPDCVLVERDMSGKLSGAAMLSVGAGRAPTLTCPTYCAYSVASCSVDVVLLVTADTGTMLCDKTAGRVRRAIVRKAGIIFVSL